MKKAVVVGSGLGGIASALRLKSLGYNVSILDKQSDFGGKAGVVKSDPFFYDKGPTVITAKFLIEELFSLFEKNSGDYVNLLPVSPWYAYEFNDGRRFHYGPNKSATLKEIERLFPEDVDRYEAFYQHTKKLFSIGYEEFGVKPFDNIGTFLSCLPRFLKLRAFESCHKTVSRFFSSPDLINALSVPPLLVGGNPFNTPSIYLLIHYLENKWGIVYPEGGVKNLIKALVKLAKEEGIHFHEDSEVTGIKTSGRKVSGIVVKNKEILPTDLMVFNGDPMHFYQDLFPKKLASWGTWAKTANAKSAMGLYVVYFSTKVKYGKLPHHLILLSDSFKKHIYDIFEKKILPKALNIYLHRPSATDPSASIVGHDSFYALIPVPNLSSSIDWVKESEGFKNHILDSLEKRVMPNLRKEIVDIHVMNPSDFSNQQNCHMGSAFTLQPTLSQSAYFRFPNKIAELDNGYFVGAGTHPGAGVPGVLTSAKILQTVL